MRTIAAKVWAGVMSLPLVLSAQAQGTVRFHTFKPLPAGQYTTVTTATRDGKPMGAPVTDTRCVGATAPDALAGIARVADTAATGCTIHVLRDEPSVAEYEQVCAVGRGEQRNHMLIQNVDGKTFTVDSSMRLPGPEGMAMASHAVARLGGACTAGQIRTMEAQKHAPALPPPSADDCAQLPEARREAEDLAASCSTISAGYAETCAERAKAARQMIALEEQSCRKP